MTLLERLRRRLRKALEDSADFFANFTPFRPGRGSFASRTSGVRGEGGYGPRRQFPDFTDVVSGGDSGYEISGGWGSDFEDLPPGIQARLEAGGSLPPGLGGGGGGDIGGGGIAIQPIPRQEGRADLAAAHDATANLTGFPRPSFQMPTGPSVSKVQVDKAVVRGGGGQKPRTPPRKVQSPQRRRGRR
jgi:hypothetical protein